MIEDIKVVAEKEFAFLFDNAKIVMNKGFFGTTFNILTGNKTGGSCC
jgi:hypothetical protein